MSPLELEELKKQLKKLIDASYIKPSKAPHGYYQVRIVKENKPKTTWVIRYGSYEFLFMPFELSNALATFCMLMNKLDIERAYGPLKTHKKLSLEQVHWQDFLVEFDYRLEYKPRHANIMANTLNKKVSIAAINQLESSLMLHIKEGPSHDATTKMLINRAK
ncbi:uncharacterized protein LOC111290167 [Durio zibethinus]|uniref:Uncharacterized protein LOC111290167 n=1 Tax=Durio zibethinus TaxID=66656 RepID=A0A6P5YB39_DURZI|nr:uncharacterized protein LOC111290167 [Durio zibethinus]